MALVNWNNLHGNAFAGKKALITGGAGFIGSNIAEVLLKLGTEVVVIDDLSGGLVSNFDTFKDQYQNEFSFVEGSILNTELLKDAIAGCDYVFHQAAWGSVPRSVTMPVEYNENNTVGTQILLQAAVDHKVKRVVFAASSSAYGDSVKLPKVEDMPVRPKSPYAANKIACEALMRAYANCYEIDTASLRYFNIFGPRQNANSAYAAVIAAFAKALDKSEQPTIFGDGEQSRDFTFVDNAVHANLLAAQAEKPINGEVMNIACANRITVNQLAIDMASMWNKPEVTPIHLEERAGDVKHSLADLSMAKELIGYEPQVKFKDGLAETVEWYKEVFAAEAAC
ncbi:NAD-dependent epimerase/dehydratase family protein [Poriferisphaera sp. WC338]|uniref:NAD-dependent epimerase/dehydratase family protein n=1 Tax=Poriferisphaera sp. WC338 TaxID=3425129 RepID=UPI003D814519